MSTRGAVGIKIDGQWKISYNNSGSYPSGLGTDVVKFCNLVNGERGWEQFKESCRKLQLVDEDVKPNKEQIEKYKDMANLGVSEQSPEDWYCLLCGYQGVEVLLGIYNRELEHLIDYFDFLKDGLFCEYAYIIDLDTMNLLLFKGGSNKPQSKSKFSKTSPLPFPKGYDKEANKYREKRDSKYYPVEFRKAIPLNNFNEDSINEESLDKLFKEIYPEEYETVEKE